MAAAAVGTFCCCCPTSAFACVCVCVCRENYETTKVSVSQPTSRRGCPVCAMRVMSPSVGVAVCISIFPLGKWRPKLACCCLLDASHPARDEVGSFRMPMDAARLSMKPWTGQQLVRFSFHDRSYLKMAREGWKMNGDNLTCSIHILLEVFKFNIDWLIDKKFIRLSKSQ